MRALRSSSARAVLGAVVVMVAGTACADKAFTPEKAALNPRMKLQVSTITAQQVAPTARYIWVAVAGIIPDGDTALLSMANVPVTGGTQTITLDVDISRCLAANAAQGRGGCSIIVGAVLRSDSITMKDSSDTGTDPFMRAFDYVIIGPFDVSSGRAPTIPPIDLSLSRFSVFDWEPDEALRLGAAHHAANLFNTPVGRVLAGTASGTGNPVLYTVTRGFEFTTIPTSPGNQPIQPQEYPALAIFANGTWRRVLATTAPALGNTGTAQGFMDVTAPAINDVYLAATSGLYKFDGTAFSRINGVTDTLYAVASAPTAGGGRVVIAGGRAGIVWIGYGASWQQYSTGSSARFDGVCITGPSEAFASSSVSGAVYRFNGTSWTSVPTPSTASKVDLQCPGPGQAYVTASGAGFYRWTAGGWAAIPATGLAPSRQVRMAAVSAAEIYAVGDSAITDRAFYRFDGTSWTEIGRRRFVQGPLRVWADPRGGAAYALSSFGRLEKITPSATTVLSYQPALRDVVMTASNSAFAVGWNLFLARWDGAKWTVDSPPAGTPSVRILQGVWSDGPNNAWAVGAGSTILRYNGSSWSVLSDINKPIATADGYNAVWGTGSDVWVAGEGTIMHCRSATPCAVEASGGGALYSIWGSSASNVFAVGASGRILRYNGTSWSQMTSPTGRNLARVAGSGPSDVWAVGDSVLVHFDGTQWTNFPMTEDLMRAASRVPSFQQSTFQLGLWVRGPREAYLGGDNGVILRWDGSEWQQTRDGFFFGRRVLSITGAAGCAMALTEAQSDLPAPTMWRGVGTNGCLSSAMGAPTSWP